MKAIFILGIAYFLINWCVYSAHNYMLVIISHNTNLTPKQYSILDILQIIKFFGAFFWTNLADRTKKHSLIISVGLVGYAVFFSAFRFAPKCLEAKGLNFFTFFYKGVSTFFLSSVFATMDAFVLEYLEQKGKERKLYGRIKMFSCIGHGFAHIALRQLEKLVGDNLEKGMCSIILTLAIAFLAAFFISFFFMRVNVIFEKKIKNKDSFSKKLKKNFGYIKELIGINLILLICFITLQGIHRQSVTTYLELYYIESNLQKSEISVIFAIRCLPELGMYFLTPLIDKAIGMHWMLFASACFGIFRPISYSFIHLGDYSNKKKTIWVYGLEVSKGIFSALFGYAASKLVKEISTPNTKSLAQGIYNGCYSGFAPCISGILGYYLLGTDIFLVQNSDVRGLYLLTGLLGGCGILFMIALIVRKVKERKRLKRISNDFNSVGKSSISYTINS
ncbi:hypothetical protein GVAV_000650 [Gurleya vavrai]